MKAPTCFECGAADRIHQHHVVPRSLGGTKTVPLCEKCHSAVHGKSMSVIELTRRGLARRMKAGLRYGQIPYGKMLVDGVLVDNPVEQRLIKTAKEYRETGASLRDVAYLLERDGFRNRNGVNFNPNSIRRLVGEASV